MDPTVVAAWIAAGVSVLTLVGTLVAQYLGYRATSRDAEKTAGDQRRQLDRTLDAQNEQLDRTLDEQRTRTLNERFATAAEQLGSDKPTVRLAGLYAMASLADDWEANRQTCVDVLCAYLRMPYAPDPGPDVPEPLRLAFLANREVRHAVIRVISAHLKRAATVSWQGLDLDFTGVVFDGGNFSFAHFSGGLVSFAKTQFNGGLVSFTGVWFSGATVDFSEAEFSGGEVDFTGARFSRHSVSFADARFSGGKVGFSFAKFTSGIVFFSGARFSGATVDFVAASFSGAAVSFSGAWFSGPPAVNFAAANFSGAEVDFSNVGGWSCPPKFPWTGTPPPGVKLPSKDQPKA